MGLISYTLVTLPKEFDWKKSNLFKIPFGRRKKDNIYGTMLDRT
jgi:hypothetical protein